MWDIIKSSSLRIKTALVMLVVVCVVGFVNSPFVTWALLGILMLVGLKEMLAILKLENKSIFFYATVIWICSYFYPHPQDLVFVLMIIFASMVAYKKEIDKNIIIPLLYPLVPFLFLIGLYYEFGMLALLWLIAVVAGTDVGAYFVGKAIGKHKFCETSPNKTIEGVIGGVLIGSLFGTIFAFLGLSFFTALFISILVSIASVFGDLFESFLKREAGIKDSGDIFPGHGGVLDRMDGYLFGGIIMVVLLKGILWLS